jgi:hypothetical protein
MAVFSALSGIIGQQGAQAGGNMAGDAANRAAQMQKEEAGRSRQALSPWTSTGIGATGKIAGLLGLGELRMSDPSNPNSYWGIYGDGKAAQDKALADFQTSPGYQFRMDEGSKALDRSAASRGLLRSGAQQKAITAFGQGAASEEYGNYLGNLFTAAGMGSQAASSGNATAGQLVSDAGNNIYRGGAARGSGYAAGANALASGISSGVSNAANLLSFGGAGGKLGLPGWS